MYITVKKKFMKIKNKDAEWKWNSKLFRNFEQL